MNGLDLLETTYTYLPLAVLADLVVLHVALRWGHRRLAKRRAR